jgi:mRNA interferase HigB
MHAPTLREFARKHPICKQQLNDWEYFIKQTPLENPNDIKTHFPPVKILKNNRFVFKIKGNEFRLIAKINFQQQICDVRFVGTHSEYDKINADVI